MSDKKYLVGFWVLALSAAFLASEAAAMPTDFSKMYVFGDSLSDTGNDILLSNGNVPPPTRYSAGRFSNGQIWIDALAVALNIDPAKLVPSLSPDANVTNFQANYSINYAYGGAGTGNFNSTPGGQYQVTGLLGQVAQFSAFVASAGGTTDPAHSLYTVWSGANDYLLAGVVPEIPNPPSPAGTVANIQTAIQDLYDLGARNFLVPTLPDLGNTPLANFFGPGTQAYFTAMSVGHNALLLEALYGLRNVNPGITFYSPDIFSLYQEILDNPLAFGFTQPLTALGPATGCLILSNDCSALPTLLSSGGYPTWDEEHPTDAMHTLIAQRALGTNALIPEPATWTLFFVGFISLVLGRRGGISSLSRLGTTARWKI